MKKQTIKLSTAIFMAVIMFITNVFVMPVSSADYTTENRAAAQADTETAKSEFIIKNIDMDGNLISSNENWYVDNTTQILGFGNSGSSFRDWDSSSSKKGIFKITTTDGYHSLTNADMKYFEEKNEDYFNKYYTYKISFRLSNGKLTLLTDDINTWLEDDNTLVIRQGYAESEDLYLSSKHWYTERTFDYDEIESIKVKDENRIQYGIDPKSQKLDIYSVSNGQTVIKVTYKSGERYIINVYVYVPELETTTTTTKITTTTKKTTTTTSATTTKKITSTTTTTATTTTQVYTTPPSVVDVKPSKTELTVGDTVQLTFKSSYIFDSKYYQFKDVSYYARLESGNEKIATVDSDGVVHAVGEGETYIEVHNQYTFTSLRVQITVKPAVTTTTTAPVTTTTVTIPTSITIAVGEQYKVNSGEKELTYKSSDTALAIVSKTGVITALSEGTVKIFAVDSDDEASVISVTIVKDSVAGDGNSDGIVSIADIVIIQKWIVYSDTSIGNWRACDLNNDGIVNSFDITCLRKILTKKQAK